MAALRKEKLPLSFPIKIVEAWSPFLMFLPFCMQFHHQYLCVPKSVTHAFCFTVGICLINRIFLLLENIPEMKKIVFEIHDFHIKCVHFKKSFGIYYYTGSTDSFSIIYDSLL